MDDKIIESLFENAKKVFMSHGSQKFSSKV